jgi:TonB-dependent starch-binding outer membrane protein SusC
MRIIIKPLLYLKILLIGCAVCIQSKPANAAPGIPGEPADIYINIDKSTLHLKQLFKLIEKQTPFSFAYDETDINLSTQLKLTTGPQILKNVLDVISQQTGLYFTEKANVILVQKIAKAYQVALDKTAQADTLVKGVVRDAEGLPLQNVTVAVKGTNKTVQTDADGAFAISVPANATLVFTFVGYSAQEVKVAGQASLSVSMIVQNKDLNEVVVVGYQPQRRADLAGAVSVVNAAGVAKLPVAGLDQALQGKAAGVRITQATGQPGEGVIVRIRGVGTINNNDPLFIIDGVPTKDGINFLSPNDIESIIVLKDASSAAIYGARAANGVVVVTTKNGKRGKPQFSYSGYYGIQTHGTLPKMLNTAEYVELYNEAVVNDNMDITNASLKRKLLPDTLPMANTDWLDAIFQNGMITSHELSVAGGSDKVRYYISGNYFKQDGILLNSWYERYALLSKLNLDLTSRLTLANNINVSYTKKNMVGSSGDGYGGNGGSVIRYALFRTPAIPIYNGDGSFTDLPDYPNFFGDGYNPVALAEKTDNKEMQYRVFTNIYAEYKILKNLRFKSDAGLDAIITDAKRFDENYGTNLRINSPSRLTESSADNFNFIWNNTLRYNTVINSKHNLTAVVGTEAITNTTRVQGGSDSKFPEQIPNLRYLGLGLSLSKNVFESQQEWALFSLFGNVNYTYNNKYLFSFNVRRDGSSRFSEANKYGTFYSGSAGWNIHNEKWVQDNLPAFSKMKLRASFGQLGNQDIGNYPWASIIGRGYNYVFGAPPTSNPGYTVSSRGNEDVKWESSTQANAGLDLGIWKDKLNLTVDYYVKRTSDMLIPIPLPLIGGSASTPYVNAGKVENRGVEIEMNYSNNSHAFKYDLSVNFATLKNKVLSLASGEPIPGGRIDNGVYATLTTVGQPIGSFYLYQMDGIFQNQADIIASAYQGSYIRPGDVKFKDVNSDGVINEKDRTFLGSAIPKFTYGATANFSYSNFDLSLFFQGQNGNKLYLQVNQDIEGFYRAFNLTQRVYDERWHGEGTSNTMPRVSWLGSTNNKTPSSRFLEDGSYVRLKNIQMGYSIPQKITERWKVSGLRIYFTGQNLWTLTNYTGLDPEMHTSDNLNAEKYRGDVAAGIDWGTFPSAKSYIIGVNLNF